MRCHIDETCTWLLWLSQSCLLSAQWRPPRQTLSLSLESRWIHSHLSVSALYKFCVLSLRTPAPSCMCIVQVLPFSYYVEKFLCQEVSCSRKRRSKAVLFCESILHKHSPSHTISCVRASLSFRSSFMGQTLNTFASFLQYLSQIYSRVLPFCGFVNGNRIFLHLRSMVSTLHEWDPFSCSALCLDATSGVHCFIASPCPSRKCGVWRCILVFLLLCCFCECKLMECMKKEKEYT